MQKEDEKKIKSAPKTRFKKSEIISLIAALIVIFSGLIFALLFVFNETENLEYTEKSCSGVQLQTGCYELERADTNEQRMKGLSDRDSLGDKSGMLFTFETSEEQCFWMKDMKFNIDMIWLNEAKEIIKVEKNVSPSTYPESFCAEQTKYVLEFNSGVSDQDGLKVGSTVQF